MDFRFDVDEIEVIVDKVRFYKDEEDLKIEDFEDKFNDVSYSYKSSNEDKLIEIGNLIINNLNTLSNIHSNNVLVLDKRIGMHIEQENKSVSILNDIDVNM